MTAAIAAAPALADAADDGASSKTRGKAKTVGGPRVDAFYRYRYALRLLTCLKKEENLTLALLAARADNATGTVEGHTIDAILNGDLPKGAQLDPEHRFTRKQSKSTFLRNLEFFETKMVMQRPDGTVVPAVKRITKRSAGKVKNDVSSYVIHDEVLQFYLGKPRPLPPFPSRWSRWRARATSPRDKASPRNARRSPPRPLPLPPLLRRPPKMPR